jgi:hypothetical protein
MSYIDVAMLQLMTATYMLFHAENSIARNRCCIITRKQGFYLKTAHSNEI